MIMFNMWFISMPYYYYPQYENNISREDSETIRNCRTLCCASTFSFFFRYTTLTLFSYDSPSKNTLKIATPSFSVPN